LIADQRNFRVKYRVFQKIWHHFAA